MRIQYLRRKKTVLLGFDDKASLYVAVVMEPLEDEGKIDTLIKELSEKKVKAVVYPFILSLDSEKIRDFYLETVGDLVNNDILFINLEGEFMPFEKGPLITTKRYKEENLLTAIDHEDLKALIIPSIELTDETIKLSSKPDILIGDGEILPRVEGLLEVPYIIVIDKVESFTYKTGVSEIQERKEISIKASKIEKETQTQIIAL